jgi:hypothetical protein
MHFSKLCFTVLCAVLCLTTLSAQNDLLEGYYVSLNKDTVRGFFNLDGLDFNKVLYYANKTTHENKKLTPETIQYIETVNKVSIRTFFYTYSDKKEPLFIRKYADGNVVLYEGHTSNINEKKVYLISSSKMPLIRKISKTDPKQFLNTYFKGCELGAHFTVDYSENSLLAAVTEISKCAYPEVEIVKNIGKQNKVHLEIGFQTAICVNNTTVKSWLNNQPIKTSVNPLFGIVVGFDVAHSFKLYTGINYFKRELTGKDSIRRLAFTNLGWVNRVDKPFNVATEFLEIPIAVHCEFNKKNPTYIPKFILGVGIMTPLRTTKYQEYFDAGGRYVDATYGLYRKGLINPSFFIGGGVKKHLKNQSSLDTNLKFVYGTDDPTQTGRFFNKRLELSVNYLFALAKK